MRLRSTPRPGSVLAAVALSAAVAGCEPGGSGRSPFTRVEETATCDPEPIRTAVGELLDSGMVQDLGTIQVGQRVTFEVPAGTGSFLVVQQQWNGTAAGDLTWQGFTISNTVIPHDLRDPNGVVYWDDLVAWPADVTGLLAFKVGWEPLTGTFGVPNTTAGLDALQGGQLTPGTWSFAANDWAYECLTLTGCAGGSGASVYQYHVVTKPVPGGTSTLDLEVYLATDPANPVTAVSSAANAAQSAGVARWRQTLANLLSGLGITLGAVRFHELSAEDLARFAPGGSVDISDGGPCGKLQQLFTTATVPSRAVHLFLADELVDAARGDGFTTLGVDGAIPGPSGFPGTILGGAIVGVQDEIGQESPAGACGGPMNLAGCGSDVIAYISAHEIGHWLGLFHTTEGLGVDFDPLSDTTTCPCSSCAPAEGNPSPRSRCTPDNGNAAPTSMLASYCGGTATCGGARNLMFWLYSGASTGELSVQQGEVARRNPAVR